MHASLTSGFTIASHREMLGVEVGVGIRTGGAAGAAPSVGVSVEAAARVGAAFPALNVLSAGASPLNNRAMLVTAIKTTRDNPSFSALLDLGASGNLFYLISLSLSRSFGGSFSSATKPLFFQ